MNQVQKSLNKLINYSHKTQSIQLSRHISYRFSQARRVPKPIEQSVKQLKQILFTQTKLQQKTKYNTNKYKQLLQSIGWTITKKDSTLQMNKQTKTHQFHTVITIKPPIQINQQLKQSFIQQKQLQIESLEQQLQKKKDTKLKKQLQSFKQYLQQSPFQQNMVQITVFVTKKGIKQPKHLCLQFLANSKFANLQNATLWSKIILTRLQRFSDCHEFTGRGINRLELEASTLLAMEIEGEWELRKEVLSTMFELTVCYEQEEYIKWLKNFNQVL